MDRTAALVALCLVRGVGGVTLRALLECFGTLEAVLAASEADLQRVPGVGPHIAAGIKLADPERTLDDLERWCADGIGVLAWDEPPYPACVRALRDAPPVLFCRGTLCEDDARAVSIVGTRQPSARSRALAGQMATELAQRGWTLVSGLAWGVDSAVHEGALAGGRTLAVLGSGVNAPLPEPRASLAARIAGQGVLLSEVHPEAAPSPSALVARNRLIAGLARAVIVIEAGAESGSLYAARHAVGQGRALFAIDNGSAGNASLVAHAGAIPLAPDYSAWDDLAARLALL